MASFDFISDEDFRTSLETDYRELLAAMEHGAWKTVYVLSGSIVEAVLVDYLLAVGYQNRSSRDPLSMTLGELIATCKTEGILSQRSADLSAVVKDYRNLIHPGRAVRLQETTDSEGAKVALALVEIIVKDVQGTKKRTYGQTAEQIVAKVEQDSSVVGVIEHVLKGVSEYELERLLVTVLPRLYFAHGAAAENAPYSVVLVTHEVLLPTLAKCFRRTFDFATVNVKRKATENFVKIIRTEANANVLAYEADLFCANDLQYLNPDDAALVAQHVLARLHTEKGMSLDTFLHLITGLGAYINEGEALDFTDDVMHMVTRNVAGDSADNFISRVAAEYAVMSAEAESTMSNRVKSWRAFLESRNQVDGAAAASALYRALALALTPDDLPF
jgi:hypothetical protein